MKDIYETSRKKTEPVPFTDRDRADDFVLPWAQAARRQTMSNIIFSVVLVLCTIAIIGAIVWYEAQTRSQRKHVWQAAPPGSGTGTVALVAQPLDSLSLLLLDELVDQRAKVRPLKMGDPLDVTIVKQLTYHIIRAEKAERDQDYREALMQYQKVRELLPDLKGLNRRLGMLHLRLNQYEEALKHFEATTREEELTAGLLNNLGVCYMGLGKYDDAISKFEAALKLEPSYALSHFNLAMAYVKTETFDKAATALQRYLELMPDDLSAVQTYALTLMQLRRWSDAILVLERLTRELPDVAPLYFRLAEAYAQLTNAPGAVTAIRRAATLVDARNALSWAARPAFDSVRNTTEFQQMLQELTASR